MKQQRDVREKKKKKKISKINRIALAPTEEVRDEEAGGSGVAEEGGGVGGEEWVEEGVVTAVDGGVAEGEQGGDGVGAAMAGRKEEEEE